MNGAFRLGVVAAAGRDGGVSPPGPTDPLFSFVESLVHFDGADGSTVFADIKGLTWSVTGDAELDDAQSKFGGVSGRFPRGSHAILAVGNRTLPAGTVGSNAGDFCIECWLRPDDFVEAGGFFHLTDAGGAQSASLRLMTNGTILAVASNSRASSAIAADTWHHVALTREERNARLFVNGVQQGSAFTSFGGTGAGIVRIHIGAMLLGSSQMQSFNGWVDDARVTLGHARYTANFTPPDAPFPNS